MYLNVTSSLCCITIFNECTHICVNINIFQRNYIPINALFEILLSICIKFSFYRFLKIYKIFEKIPLIFCFLTTFFSCRLLKMHFTIFNTNDINGWNFSKKKSLCAVKLLSIPEVTKSYHDKWLIMDFL